MLVVYGTKCIDMKKCNTWYLDLAKNIAFTFARGGSDVLKVPAEFSTKAFYAITTQRSKGEVFFNLDDFINQNK